MATIPSIARLCLVVLVASMFMEGSVAPFPPGDPRAIFNPLIVPWWRHAPLRMRQFIHLAVTGTRLPPNDLANLPPTRPRRPLRLPRLRMPFFFRSQRPWAPKLVFFCPPKTPQKCSSIVPQILFQKKKRERNSIHKDYYSAKKWTILTQIFVFIIPSKELCILIMTYTTLHSFL